MDTLPKCMTSFITIVLGVVIALSLVVSSVIVNSARTYHASVIDQIEAANFEDATIQKCISKSKEDHYEVNIVPVSAPETDPSLYYKVTLKYNLTAPIFGKIHSSEIVGYALAGARVAVVNEYAH